jgi:hypothetical protein
LANKKTLEEERGGVTTHRGCNALSIRSQGYSNSDRHTAAGTSDGSGEEERRGAINQLMEENKVERNFRN